MKYRETGKCDMVVTVDEPDEDGMYRFRFCEKPSLPGPDPRYPSHENRYCKDHQDPRYTTDAASRREGLRL